MASASWATATKLGSVVKGKVRGTGKTMQRCKEGRGREPQPTELDRGIPPKAAQREEGRVTAARALAATILLASSAWFDE